MREEASDAGVVKYYELVLKGREVLLRRKTIRDVVTKKAESVVYEIVENHSKMLEAK